MREGINGHVAAEHAPLETEHFHQRHYPRLQLLLVPIHAEDAFHGRDADTGVTASADRVQVGLPSPIAIDAKINRPAHDCDREANFWILADYVQEIGQLRGEHFQPAAQIRPLQALKTPQPSWVRHQIGPWSEAAKRIVVVPSEMLAHGSQVRKRAVEIQALRRVWIAEVNQANKRNWDFRSRSHLLRPRHLLDGILGDEFVPDEAVYLPRAGCSEIVIEKVSPRQRGVIPDKSFKSRVFPCKNTVAVGFAVVEMNVCIDDCRPASERGSCHLAGADSCIATTVSAYVFRHHYNNDDLQDALSACKPDIDSVDTDNPFAVRLRLTKLPPDTQAVWQQEAQTNDGHHGDQR